MGPPVSIYLMLFLSGDNNWVYGKVFLYITSISIYLICLYLLKYNPGLLYERFRFRSEDQDKKDKGFVNNIGKYLLLLFYVIIPIDHKYSVFPDFSNIIHIVSAIIIFESFLMILFVFKQNSFASPIIRNQKEREHIIITDGLYKYVRHPMYTACVFIFIFTPIMLDSLYGLIFSLYICYMFCKRIKIEEEFLTNEFIDYSNYKKKVKYKIFPYIY